MSFCGLDFGTSNSTIGIIKDNNIDMVSLEEESKLLRSAIFLDDEELKIYFGKQAVSHYIDGVEGRLMVSIKSVLGTSLMKEETRVFNKMEPFSKVLGYFIKNIKDKAEHEQGNEINSVVLGRPVRFSDKDDNLDKLAEDMLREIATNQGFKNIEFQYEPIAAALAYEKKSKKEELALIVDIGGGTSDFTIIKINPKKNTPSNILSSDGIHIGGTDFDTLLSYNKIMPYLGLNATMKAVNGSNIGVPINYYRDLSTWHRINSLYNKIKIRDIEKTLAYSNEKKLTDRFIKVLKNKNGHKIIEKIEYGKKMLSSNDNILLNFNFIENGFSVDFIKNEFENLISPDLYKIKNVISNLTKTASVKNEDIDVVFFTGGTSQITKIQQDIMKMFKNAKAVKGDMFGSVGVGLTIDALNKFS